MTKHNRFKRGQGVFKCRECGKRTRDVNGSNGGLELCELCEHKSGMENTLVDHGYQGDAWALLNAGTTVTEVDQIFSTAWAELMGKTP